MDFVDTHSHPHFENFADDVEAVVRGAADAGVSRLIVVGTTFEDSQKAIDFAAGHKNSWAAAGVHPHAAREYLEASDSPLYLRSLLTQPKVVAVGEIGLDFYRSFSTAQEQETILRSQLDEGLVTKLPFIFHVREAWDIFWQIIDSYKGIRGVVHSFSASDKELNQILERGLYVGLNGIMTFTKDEKQLDAAKKVPLERLLLETDAPFLAPKPYRGQRCEPKYIKTIAEFLAELRGEPLEELAQATTQNALNLFGLEPKDG